MKKNICIKICIFIILIFNSYNHSFAQEINNIDYNSVITKKPFIMGLSSKVITFRWKMEKQYREKFDVEVQIFNYQGKLLANQIFDGKETGNYYNDAYIKLKLKKEVYYFRTRLIEHQSGQPSSAWTKKYGFIGKDANKYCSVKVNSLSSLKITLPKVLGVKKYKIYLRKQYNSRGSMTKYKLIKTVKSGTTNISAGKLIWIKDPMEGSADIGAFLEIAIIPVFKNHLKNGHSLNDTFTNTKQINILKGKVR